MQVHCQGMASCLEEIQEGFQLEEYLNEAHLLLVIVWQWLFCLSHAGP